MTKQSLRELRHLGEVIAVVVVGWLLLGWYFDRAITQGDGTLFLVPYTQSQLASASWTDHLYRFGVMGGTPMHDYAGTLPLVQLCSLLGLSATTTANIGTLFLQVCFGFFGLTAIRALGPLWSERPIVLSATERVATIALCSFAPVLGWRLGLGHENIIQGLLPILVGCSLIWAARANELGACALLLGGFAVWNAASGLGAQLLVYSVLFGAPIAMVALIQPRRFDRATVAALAMVVAGVLLALPRVAGIFAYASSGDAGRSVGGSSMIFEFGAARWGDWLASIPWKAPASGGLIHEQNYPIGPLLCFAILLWPRGRSRWLAAALLASALLAVLFAGDVPPFSTVLAAIVPPLKAFRIPARAILPALVFLPIVALAALWIAREKAREGEPDRKDARLVGWLGIAIGAAIVGAHAHVPAVAREVVAWLACAGLAFVARWKPRILQRYAAVALIGAIAAIGVTAFGERVPSQLPNEPVEGAPASFHAAVLAQAPELATPLYRVIAVSAPPPYRMSLPFAARLGTIDGDFNPPRRFTQLVGALRGRDMPSTAVVFELAGSRAFPILQQLYNVRYAITFEGGAGTLQPLRPTPGPAWMPARVDVADDATAVAKEMWAHPAELDRIAWVLPGDRRAAPATCDGKVEDVKVDELGQQATIDVDAKTPCTLIVATNYVHQLHARAGAADLPIFPIDVALTGIGVPAGRSTIVLGPSPHIPWWSRVAFVAGLVLVGASITLASRSRRQRSSVA